ncbi:MAG: hypothetical protein QXO15_03400 [Nitrososphaerota archaeon]
MSGIGKIRNYPLLARVYLDLQHLRIAVESRLRELGESPEDMEAYRLLSALHSRLYNEEKEWLNQVKELLKDHPIWEYCEKVKGMGPVAALTFLGYINPYEAVSAGKVWAYFGFTPESKLKSGKKANFNPEAKGQVTGKIYKFEANINNWIMISNETKEKICRMYIEGYSSIEIAKALGISATSVLKVLKSAGIKTRTRKEAYWLSFSKGKIKKARVKLPSESWKLAYLAGLIDGEGTISMRTAGRVIPNVRVRVYNTNEQVIKWIHENFGGSIFSREEYDKKTKRKLRIWYWGIHSIEEAVKLLKPLLPYLIVKKDNALELIKASEKIIPVTP